MSFFFTLALIGIAALIARQAWTYHQATGTVAQRLAAAWKDTMTIFAAIWVTIFGYIVSGMDGLAKITGEPEFKTIADKMTALMTPQVQTIVAAALPALTAGLIIWARMRTAGRPR